MSQKKKFSETLKEKWLAILLLFGIISGAVVKWKNIYSIEFWISASVLIIILSLDIILEKLKIPSKAIKGEFIIKNKFSNWMRTLCKGLIAVVILGWISFLLLNQNKCNHYDEEYFVIVPNFEEKGENSFSKKIVTEISKTLPAKTKVIPLNRYKSVGDDINLTIDSLSGVICNFKGVVAYGNWSKEEDVFDCFVKLVNMKDDSVKLTFSGNSPIYIESPSNMPFTVNSRGEYVGKFIKGILNYHNGRYNIAIKNFEDINRNNFSQPISESGTLSDYLYFCNIYLGNSYLKSGKPIDAINSYQIASQYNSKDSTLIEIMKRERRKVVENSPIIPINPIKESNPKPEMKFIANEVMFITETDTIEGVPIYRTPPFIDKNFRNVIPFSLNELLSTGKVGYDLVIFDKISKQNEEVTLSTIKNLREKNLNLPIGILSNDNSENFLKNSLILEAKILDLKDSTVLRTLTQMVRP